MGLDLVVEGCPRPGYEAEWRRLLEGSFKGAEPTQEDLERFAAISIPPYERLGAPRVGYDSAADAWIIAMSKPATPQEAARVVEEAHGYYVLRLVESDGVPEYSHGGLYEGVDETSFRGEFLSGCTDVLAQPTIDEAWGHKFPEEALAYGNALGEAADAAEAAGVGRVSREPRRGLFSLFRKSSGPASTVPREEQLAIVRAAGRWFIFWGERGHAIRAWF